MTDNGMTLDEQDDLDDLEIAIDKIAEEIAKLPPHRSYSLAITKLDEARHWLLDRKRRAP